MKIKLNSDDDVSLNKTIEFPTTTIVVRSLFHENNKIIISFLRRMSINYKLWIILIKCYIMIELTFLKKLMLIKQVHKWSAIFVTTGIF